MITMTPTFSPSAEALRALFGKSYRPEMAKELRDIAAQGGEAALEPLFTALDSLRKHFGEKAVEKWPDLFEMASSARSGTWSVFTALPMTLDCLSNYYSPEKVQEKWPDLVKLVKRAGSHSKAGAVLVDLCDALNAVNEHLSPGFSEASLKQRTIKLEHSRGKMDAYWPHLMEIALAAAPKADWALAHLPSLLKAINKHFPEKMEKIWPRLVLIALAQGPETGEAFNHLTKAAKTNKKTDLIDLIEKLEQKESPLAALGNSRRSLKMIPVSSSNPEHVEGRG